MTEKDALEFFRKTGFREENNVFIGEEGYDFLVFNNSLLIGKNEKDHFRTEAMFSFDKIRSLDWDPKRCEILVDTFD